jgi:hypothetical protein
MYALEVAPEDVRLTLDWLEGAGFNLANGRGGPTESFGDVCLNFVGPADVRIVRDRGQWDVTVGPTGGVRPYSLAVLDAARLQRDWEPPDLNYGAVPKALPAGVTWMEVLPAVVKWIGEPGSVEAAEQAESVARQKMAERLGFKAT